MRFSHRGSIAALAAAAVVGVCALPGCGGGGSGASAGGASTMGVFVTDAVGSDFKQVWVTLYKIEAKADGSNSFITLFEDPNGVHLNLSSMADTAQLLNSVSVPAGNYTQVQITFGDQLSLVPLSGGAAVTVPVADDIGTHTTGKVAVTINASTPAPSGQLSNLVVDFDLAATQLTGGKLRPALKKGDDNQFQGKKKHAAMEGVAQNVAADSFDLLHESRVFKVHTTDKTEFFSARSGQAVTLTNGKKVEVKGDIDPATHEITASSVKIIDNEPGDCVDCGPDENTRAEAFGSVATVDTGANTFVVTLSEAEHFKPSADTVTIQTTQATQYKWPLHDGVSFASMASSQKVVVVGTYDPNTNTILARFVLIQPASE